MTTRIFLVDDHHLVRQGLRLLLEGEPDFEVTGEAGDGASAVEAALRLQPDVLIVDVVLPDMNGIDVIRKVRRVLPDIKALALSMYDADAYVFEALRAGASAYVLKKSTAGELVQAVEEVLAGRIYLSSALDAHTLEEYARRLAEPDDGDPYESLTRRERQVLQIAAQGKNNPEIAERLSLSVRTVESYRANMLRKLRLKNQTELVRYAVKRGLVE